MNVVKGIKAICAKISNPPCCKAFLHGEIRAGKLKVFKMGASTVTTDEFIAEYQQLLIKEAGIDADAA